MTKEHDVGLADVTHANAPSWQPRRDFADGENAAGLAP